MDRQLSQNGFAGGRAGSHKEAMLAVLEQFGQGQVEALFRFGSSTHRRAEAELGRVAAVGGDEEDVGTARRVVAVLVLALDEDAVLDRDRGQLAGADADEGRRRSRRLLGDREAAVLPVGLPEANTRRK